MNFFFGANYNSIYSKLQIPLFQNRKTEIKKIDLFQIKIKKNSWDLEKMHQNSIDNNFYIIDKINNDQVFFLAESSNIKKFNPQELTNLSNFTETFPEFRANLNIYLKGGGFSSYQSEYPFNMINKNGTILTPISTLLNINADKNYLIFKNIFLNLCRKNFQQALLILKRKKF